MAELSPFQRWILNATDYWIWSTVYVTISIFLRRGVECWANIYQLDKKKSASNLE